MSDEEKTFGSAISEARKAESLSQKELAAKIEISPQYLNDIEHDRRNPSSDELVRLLARVLSIDADYLYYLAGKIPEDLRKANAGPDAVESAMAAFRADLQAKLAAELAKKEKQGIQQETAARFEAAARHREDEEQGVALPKDEYVVKPWWAEEEE